jgi:hypothetical protein
VRKPWQIWWIFSLQDVLEQKKQKWQEKFDEVGPVSAQSDTFFWSKSVKFCTIGAYVCVFKRKL